MGGRPPCITLMPVEFYRYSIFSIALQPVRKASKIGSYADSGRRLHLPVLMEFQIQYYSFGALALSCEMYR